MRLFHAIARYIIERGDPSNPLAFGVINDGDTLVRNGNLIEGGTGSGGPPTGAAGGDLGGTYPNPTVTDLTIASEARGDLLTRGAAAWGRLAPGTSGYALTSAGADADLVWASYQATDAGLTSLIAADAAAGLLSVISANTWERLAIGANKGIYGTAASGAGMLATYDLTASARTLSALTVATGDLYYGSAAGVVSLLAANATATRKFLRDVSGAAPAWDTVTATDVGLSLVENTALSTWTGTTNITTLGTIATGVWSGTIIGPTKGGTGFGSYAVGDVLYADTTTTLAKLPAVATGKVLKSAGTNTAPTWAQVVLTTDVTGILPCTNGGTGNNQVVSGNTTLTTQQNHIQVTASCTITLPALSTWVIGIPTLITVRSTTAIQVVIAANALDKIEGAPRVCGYGTDITLVLLPFVANKFSCEVLRGTLMIPVVACDMSAVSGASPWTVTNTLGGTSVVFTDLPNGSSSSTGSSGIVCTSGSGGNYFTAATASGAAVRTPLTGLVDNWSRAVSAYEQVWFLTQCSKTTVVGGSTPQTTVAISTNALAGLPRVGVYAVEAATVDEKARDTATRTQTGTITTLTTAHWSGILWDGQGPQLVDVLHSAATAGNPGIDWWPTAYAANQIGAMAVDWTSPWDVSLLTDVTFGQGNGTTGSKYTYTAFAAIRVLRRM